MAKPMPTLPPDGEKIAVLTPTTWPWLLNWTSELPDSPAHRFAGSRRKAQRQYRAPRAEMMPARHRAS